eukprot:3744507-Prymnesium_polylepis.1
MGTAAAPGPAAASLSNDEIIASLLWKQADFTKLVHSRYMVLSHDMSISDSPMIHYWESNAHATARYPPRASAMVLSITEWLPPTNHQMSNGFQLLVNDGTQERSYYLIAPTVGEKLAWLQAVADALHRRNACAALNVGDTAQALAHVDAISSQGYRRHGSCGTKATTRRPNGRTMHFSAVTH